MRSRSNSGVRLDGYARLVQETILCHQVSPDTFARSRREVSAVQATDTVVQWWEKYLDIFSHAEDDVVRAFLVIALTFAGQVGGVVACFAF